MQWLNVLLLLLCPLIMILCMRGMHGGHKHQKGGCCGGHKHKEHSSDKFSFLEAKVEELSKENSKMLKELQDLKQANLS